MILEKIFKGMSDAAQFIQRNFDLIVAELDKKKDYEFKQVTGVAGSNGWYAYNNTPISITKENRSIKVAMQFNAGVVTSGTEMAILPDWAATLLDGQTFDVACITSGWEVKTGTVVVRGNKLYCGTNITSYLVNISLNYTSKN